MEKNFFEESQKFTQVWFWMLNIIGILLFVGVACAGVYIQLIQKRPFGNNPMSDTGVIIFFFFSVLFAIGMIILQKSFHFQTKVDRFGISYRFFPFINKWHMIYREEITDWKIITRCPVNYGIRHGWKSKTLNINGNKQLALTLGSGKKLYLGTQRAEELSIALQKLFDRQLHQ